MSRRFAFSFAGALSLALAALASPRAADRQATPVATTDPAAEPRAVIDKYCVTCHNDRAKTAGLSLERADLADVPGHIPRCGKRSCGSSGRA